MGFAPDGVWHGQGGPVNTRISAVLAAISLDPWNVAAKDLTLYQNPWAAVPIEGKITHLTKVVVVDKHFQRTEGTHPRELFGLPMGWPEQE